MAVIESKKDVDALTLTFVTEWDAPLQRVWQLWSDPRQLERWWGPPGWPSTFDVFEFEPGGRATYYMTGPDGTRAWGWWRFVDIDAPAAIVLDDGFAEEGGQPSPGEAARLTASLVEEGGRTRMTIVNTFVSADQLEQMLGMGMEEGMRLALGQIDEILADSVRS